LNELFNCVMGVNLNGQFFACRTAIKVLNKQETGGTIVNVASIASYLGARGGAAYTMSKHAAIGLTKNIASFYGRENGKIRANVIAPGSIANTVLFLASDESKFINGEVVTVDGAWTTR
jgi:Dehydrogenases with different specificities (related to short-chain alcohol dehydrogenases)